MNSLPTTPHLRFNALHQLDLSAMSDTTRQAIREKVRQEMGGSGALKVAVFTPKDETSQDSCVFRLNGARAHATAALAQANGAVEKTDVFVAIPNNAYKIAVATGDSAAENHHPTVDKAVQNLLSQIVGMFEPNGSWRLTSDDRPGVGQYTWPGKAHTLGGNPPQVAVAAEPLALASTTEARVDVSAAPKINGYSQNGKTLTYQIDRDTYNSAGGNGA